MIQIYADTHTHTVASTHAFSTIMENIRVAKEKGIRAIASTDHAPAIPDGAHLWHFNNIWSVPDYVDGVLVLKGVETNILDFDGNLDISQKMLEGLDWVVASCHSPVIPPKDEQAQTHLWLEIAKNPDVDVIGHSGNPKFLYDYERCIKAFKEYGKIVEINAHSFQPGTRPGSPKNCAEIAKLCAKYQVPVIVNSDAHFCYEIGAVERATAMLEEIDFPRELILNADYDRFFETVQKKVKRDLSPAK